MTKRPHLVLFAMTVAFVASGVAFVFGPHRSSAGPALRSATEHLLNRMDSLLIQAAPPIDLPLMQMRPDGPFVLLLLTLWGLALSESAGQIIDPTPDADNRLMSAHAAGLGLGAIWPWLILPAPLLAALVAVVSALCAVRAAVLVKDEARPGIGILAGWSTMAATAMTAAVVGQATGLNLASVMMLAVIAGTVLAALAMTRLGKAVAYPLAVIGWLSALVVAMLGVSTGVTLAAIIAITAMTLALVRSVT